MDVIDTEESRVKPPSIEMHAGLIGAAISIWRVESLFLIIASVKGAVQVGLWHIGDIAREVPRLTLGLETIKPQVAIVCAERPFSCPNLILDMCSHRKLIHIPCAYLLWCAHWDYQWWFGSGSMMIKCNHVMISIFKKIIPICVIHLSIVENKISLRSKSLDKFPDLSIESFEHFDVCSVCYVVDRFKSKQVTSGTPSLKQGLWLSETPLQIGIVDKCVIQALGVPFSHPIGFDNFGEVILTLPLQMSCFIKSICSFLCLLDNEQNIDSKFSTSVEHPVNLISSSIHTSFIWTILVQSPITNL